MNIHETKPYIGTRLYSPSLRYFQNHPPAHDTFQSRMHQLLAQNEGPDNEQNIRSLPDGASRGGGGAGIEGIGESANAVTFSASIGLGDVGERGVGEV